jgi:hypothetical protein
MCFKKSRTQPARSKSTGCGPRLRNLPGQCGGGFANALGRRVSPLAIRYSLFAIRYPLFIHQPHWLGQQAWQKKREKVVYVNFFYDFYKTDS